MVEVDPIARPGYTYVQVGSAITAASYVGHITGKLPAERDLARAFGVIITRHGRADLRAR